MLNTKPNAILSDHEEWHPDAINAFKELLPNYKEGGCKVIAEVYSVTPGQFAPKITATFRIGSYREGESLNDQFRRIKDENGRRFAEYRDEKYFDKQNNASRQEHQTVFYNPGDILIFIVIIIIYLLFKNIFTFSRQIKLRLLSFDDNFFLQFRTETKNRRAAKAILWACSRCGFR